ncbi:hypothetical protein DSO57_1006715 [Entomophthora muscae]|uniref:Uncharacterized protein n=1 Tax=Entomophthora muscae TaxID=34485 RepID=A0ACC2UHB9_9FUNG|nr:hypothetical protein DSO57_1006715 [Entomophthora muscae]
MDSSQSRGLILTAHAWTKYFIVFDVFAQVLFSGVYMFAATLPLYRIFYIFAGIHVLFCGLDTWFYFGVRKSSYTAVKCYSYFYVVEYGFISLGVGTLIVSLSKSYKKRCFVKPPNKFNCEDLDIYAGLTVTLLFVVAIVSTYRNHQRIKGLLYELDYQHTTRANIQVSPSELA